MELKLYTDGANSMKLGLGAFAFVLVGIDANQVETVLHTQAKSIEKTTSNRMELLGVIEALNFVNNLKLSNNTIELISDSQYVVKGFNDWLPVWFRQNRKKVLNRDLWLQLVEVLISLSQSNNQVKFTWTKGHADNKYNNLCDKLAVDAYKTKNKTKATSSVAKYLDLAEDDVPF